MCARKFADGNRVRVDHDRFRHSTFRAHCNIGPMLRGTSDIHRDVVRYPLLRNVIVSSLRFLNSPCNKTHPRRQDDSTAQTYRRASVNTSFACRKLQFDALTFCASYSASRTYANTLPASIAARPKTREILEIALQFI